jgi:hypothetical protein
MTKKTLKVAEKPKCKQRKLASQELYPLIHEKENVSERTVYSKIFYDKRNDTWRYIGRAYDYTW